MNVLIVDDSQVVAERLEGLLSEVSDDIHVMWHARNVVEGRQAIRCGGPDVIILDIRMPGGSGMGLLEEIKREKPGPLVIILTNYPLSQYRDRCMEAGADYFFDKSAQFDQIADVLRGLLQSRG